MLKTPQCNVEEFLFADMAELVDANLFENRKVLARMLLIYVYRLNQVKTTSIQVRILLSALIKNKDMGKFKENDIVVREYNHTDFTKGFIVKVNQCDYHNVNFKDSNIDGSWSPNYFRLATNDEIQAYNNGCRHIDDIDQYLNKEPLINIL